MLRNIPMPVFHRTIARSSAPAAQMMVEYSGTISGYR
jgi:hypothetical protein